MTIFVIGLPTALEQRFLAEAHRNGVQPGLTLCAFDKKGRFVFVPFEGQAAIDLDNFSGNCNWSSLQIVVLPYAELGAKLSDSIEVLSSHGATLIVPTAGLSGWPPAADCNSSGGSFNDDLFEALRRQLGWAGVVLPSAWFRSAVNRQKDYIVLGDALDRCDEVHESRHDFLKKSSELLEKFCKKKGGVNQSLHSYFLEKGVTLAQNGGIETVIRLIKNGRQLGDPLRSNLHLKEGDGTTPQAAARIYFQHLDKDSKFRLFLLYVGPHSDHQIDRNVDWD